jgi:transketolase
MNLRKKSWQLRRIILDTVYAAKAGHIGGDFSVCDILNVLYNKHMKISPETWKSPRRDRFILSKGHSVEALYAVLADRGFFPIEDLKTVSAFGSKYIGHPTNKVKGIEINSGSLGHGLSVAAGMALAAKMDKAPYRVYTVMGDGELAEGSVWEGAMLCRHYKLDNLTAIIDRNGLQISGTTEEVMAQDDLEAKWKAFGWEVFKAEGNDVGDLSKVLEEASSCRGRPSLIIARTVKGCGVSFMENKAGWHHKAPNADEYKAACAELAEKEKIADEQHS